MSYLHTDAAALWQTLVGDDHPQLWRVVGRPEQPWTLKWSLGHHPVYFISGSLYKIFSGRQDDFNVYA